MDIETFSNTLYDTPFSTGIRQIPWLIPGIQSVHIVAIGILIGSALVMELRLAGVLATDQEPGTVVRRHLPWLWSALGVLLLTGTTLGIAEPSRVLGNSIFWWKMIAVAGAFMVTLLLRRPLLRPTFVLEQTAWRAAIKPSAWLLLGAWVFAIYCGRWIAYAL